MNIVNPVRRNLGNIAKESDIEKSFSGYGLKFIKTGKDITDKLKKKVEECKVKMAMLTAANSTLKGQIGSDPTIDYKHWEDDTDGNEITNKLYDLNGKGSTYDYGEYDSVRTSVSISNQFDQGGEIKTKKDMSQYNRNVREICRLACSINKMETVQRNLKPTQKIELRVDDLKDLGF